jgi:hypothetical protein
LISIFGRIITTSAWLQLDPPESAILSQLCASLIFVNKYAIVDSGLYDGVLRNIVSEIIDRYLSNEVRVKSSTNIVKV